MIRPASPHPLVALRRKLSGDRPAPTPPASVVPSPYDTAFWLSYVANLGLMVAISLLFRYADFVEFLGGSEFELGLIVGIGMIGSLLMRLAQGVGVDRYGTRTVWLWSLVLFIVALIAHAWPTTVHGPAVYILQLVFRVAVAGAYGAAITCVALRVNAARMAETIGMLGTSGFMAMAIGPILGDLLLGNKPSDRGTINLMFFVSAGFGAVSWIAAYLATRGQQPPPISRRPPIWSVLRRYHPGKMLMMGVIMGIGSGLPSVFVRPFATHLGVEGIAWFFTTYAVCAFFARVFTRRICEQWGVRPTIVLGMACMILGTGLFVVVGRSWHLAIPGALIGASHALLFPAIVATGGSAFPERYRGLGTALMLATLDVGVLAGAPLAGALVSLAGVLGLPGFTTMFLSIATLLTLGTIWFAWSPGGEERQNEPSHG
jgi:MFS family permease